MTEMAAPFTWRDPPSRLRPEADEIHLWRAFLRLPSMPMPVLRRMLDLDELTRADRCRLQQDRHDFVAAHGILRILLGQYLGIEPREVAFSHGRHGKPAVAAVDRSARLHFNVSRSCGLAIYAFTLDRPIGVDCEQVRPEFDHDPIVRQFFSAGERAALSALPPLGRQEAFFVAWTGKEAMAKAVGDGLSLPLDRLDIASALERRPQGALILDGGGSTCTLMRFAPTPGYVGAVALAGICPEIRLQAWTARAAVDGWEVAS